MRRRRPPSRRRPRPRRPELDPAPDPSDTVPGSGRDVPQDALLSEIRSRAVKLLTTREHSRAELARKLCARGYPGADVETVLDGLERDGLLSEERLVETYVNERLDKGFGPLRILAELRGKGLSDARIGPHLELDDDSCLERIGVVHAKRFGKELPTDRKELAKRARFLEYRGFPSHLIARFLRTDD